MCLHGLWHEKHAVKIDCVPSEAKVRKPESTSRVQQALGILIMATAQDQEKEHHMVLTTVSRGEEAVAVAMVLGDLMVQQMYRDARAFLAQTYKSKSYGA